MYFRKVLAQAEMSLAENKRLEVHACRPHIVPSSFRGLTPFFFYPDRPSCLTGFFLHPAPFSVFIISFSVFFHVCHHPLFQFLGFVLKGAFRCCAAFRQSTSRVYNVASSGFSLDRDTVPLRASHAVEHVSSST